MGLHSPNTLEIALPANSAACKESPIEILAEIAVASLVKRRSGNLSLS